jgi:hypothetical protein
MALNLGINTVLGAVPFVGDLFDFAWRANRRNLDLLHGYRIGNSITRDQTWPIVQPR